jgi:hypothetical protein
MTDTQILDYVAANVLTIDQSGPLVNMILNTGQAFQGFTLSACVLASVAAGF